MIARTGTRGRSTTWKGIKGDLILGEIVIRRRRIGRAPVLGRKRRLGIKHHALVGPLGCELGISGVEIRKLVGYVGGKWLGLLLGNGLEVVGGIKGSCCDGGRPATLGLLLDGISVWQLVLELRMGRRRMVCCRGVHLACEHGHGKACSVRLERRRRTDCVAANNQFYLFIFFYFLTCPVPIRNTVPSPPTAPARHPSLPALYRRCRRSSPPPPARSANCAPSPPPSIPPQSTLPAPRPRSLAPISTPAPVLPTASRP